MGHFEFAFLNVLVEEVDVLVVVGRDAYKHFVENDAYLIHVACLGNPLLLDHLGS